MIWNKLSAIIVVLCGTFAFCGSSNVISLNQDNFQELVAPSEEFWLVEFYESGCDQWTKFAPELEKLANAFSGLIKVGSVDTKTDGILANQYNIKEPMAILIFGTNKNKPKIYGGQRNIRDITDFVFNHIRKSTYKKLGVETAPRSDVVVLNDQNFDGEVLKSQDPWMVEFFAPWCGHCKDLKPDWENAATKMRGKVKFGAIDCTSNPIKTKGYEIQGFPTILYFPRGPKTSPPQKYDNGRSSYEIVGWAMEKYTSSLPVPEIVEVTSEEVLLDTCQDTPLCILSFLPQIFECQAKCRQNYLDILKKVAEKFKMNAWGWVWSEGGSQGDLEQALEIGGIGYPTIVVANVKKMKYALFKGSFTAENIEVFLKDVITGRKVEYYDIKTQVLPKINDITPWDGEDSEMPPTGEETEDVKDEL